MPRAGADFYQEVAQVSPLIRAGLRSPLVRNRNMALRALGAWPRDSWPSDADALLRQMIADEPNEKTLALAQSLISGEASSGA